MGAVTVAGAGVGGKVLGVGVDSVELRKGCG